MLALLVGLASLGFMFVRACLGQQVAGHPPNYFVNPQDRKDSETELEKLTIYYGDIYEPDVVYINRSRSALNSSVLESSDFLRTNLNGIAFTHSGPIDTRVAEISVENSCSSILMVKNSYALMCLDSYYLLDKQDLVRTDFLNFSSGLDSHLYRSIKSFTAFEYGLAIMTTKSSGSDPCITIINTFDTSKADVRLVNYASWQPNHYPMLKYLSWSGSEDIKLTFLIYFDGLWIPGQVTEYTNLPSQSSIVYCPMDINGLPKYGPSCRELILFEDSNRLYVNDSAKVIIHEIIAFEKDILAVFYSILPKGRLRLRVYKLDEGLHENILNLDLTFATQDSEIVLEPMFFDPPNHEYKDTSLAIVKEMAYGNYVYLQLPATKDYMICQLGYKPTSSVLSLLNCSNTLDTNTGFGTAVTYPPVFYKPEGDDLYFLSEVKEQRSAKNLTTISYLIRFQPANRYLEPRMEWDFHCKLCFLEKISQGLEGYQPSGTKEQNLGLVALKSRNFILHPRRLQLLKVDFSEIYATLTDHQEVMDVDLQVLIYKTEKRQIIKLAVLTIKATLWSNLADYARPMPNSVMVYGYPGEMVSFGLPVALGETNNLKLQLPNSYETNLAFFLDRTVDVEDLINFDLMPERKITDLVINGRFLVAVEAPSTTILGTAEQKMYIYKCQDEVLLKRSSASKTDIPKSYRPTYECNFLLKQKVNPLVKLVDVYELQNFLVIRFGSDNSVVYYKLDKYDFTVKELNLRGYNPDSVSMIEANENEIIVVHSKRDADPPMIMFTLIGQQLKKRGDIDLLQLVSYNNRIKVIGKSLVKKGKDIYLYVAICQQDSLGYLKYNVSSGLKSPMLVKKSFDMLNGLVSINNTLKSCFFPGVMFLLSFEHKAEAERDSTIIYLISLDNPTGDSRIPLYEFGVGHLRNWKISCDIVNNVVILSGYDPISSSERVMFINPFFASMLRIPMIVESKGTGCEIISAYNYYVELCKTVSSEQVPFKARLFRVFDPKVYVMQPIDGNSEALGTITALVGSKKQSIDVRVEKVAETKNQQIIKSVAEWTSNAKQLLKEALLTNRTTTLRLDIVDSLGNYTNHFLRAIVTDRNNHKDLHLGDPDRYRSNLDWRNEHGKPVQARKVYIEEKVQILKEFDISDPLKLSEPLDGIANMDQRDNVFYSMSIDTKGQLLSTVIVGYSILPGKNPPKIVSISRNSIPAVCTDFDFDITYDSRTEQQIMEQTIVAYKPIQRESQIFRIRRELTEVQDRETGKISLKASELRMENFTLDFAVASVQNTFFNSTYDLNDATSIIQQTYSHVLLSDTNLAQISKIYRWLPIGSWQHVQTTSLSCKNSDD